MTTGCQISRPRPPQFGSEHHKPRSLDVVVDFGAAVVVVAQAVGLVILEASKAPVTVGSGAIAVGRNKMSVTALKLAKKRGLHQGNAPDVGVIGLRLGAGGDVPGESHAGRERARLAAALPGMEALGNCRRLLDADIFRGRRVAQGAAVRIIRAILSWRDC